MKLHVFRNTVILFLTAIIGLLTGLWLSPQVPITSFIPTQEESDAYKAAVNILAFISGTSSSLLAFVGGNMLKVNNTRIVTVVVIVGLLYLCIDLIRFGQLTFGNLVWFFFFAFGIALILILKTLLAFFLRKGIY
ncbi:hypothetical protein [Pseudoalteromonas sp. OOF1S-7]|uniref:hypothetical protein n=1 Tax=Pseudoalteromonas sp. OOF1S-7 TaxID=2917757 RepID=UPI001EF5A7D2|nr:hypothetical protein [Pseudoalteromonas sp. OOF1S-7]MCG7537944.1 hypothetical protein [Pseudoalteromonas sp. OOF1S-7]